MRNIWIIIILAWLSAVCSCGGGSGLDAKLPEIDRLCDSIPEAAIDSLSTIDQTGLSDKDVNRYRLLWIKSRDKAYIAHTSDTLILGVIDYYDKHRSEGLYAEALYYGGRVYSDIGDLPTALEFFHKSLDEIPKDDEHLRFKSTVLNQTGRLLHSLRLDSAAIEYMEKSLNYVDPIKDAYGISFTHTLIAGSYRRLNNYKLARRHIDEAVKISSQLKESDRQTIQVEFADMLHEELKIDSALQVIRPLPAIVDSLTISYCLAIAACIYKEKRVLDTAYMYARKLTKLKAPQNKKIGYKVIFSDELKNFVPKDTLLKLMPEYKQVVEDYLDTHEAEQALIQNARYNYSEQIKRRQESEHKLYALKRTLWITVVGIAIVLLITISFEFRRKYHKSERASQIVEGLILSERLKEKSKHDSSDSNENRQSETLTSEALQRKNLIIADINIAKEQNPSESVDNKLKSSTLYKDLKEKAENKMVMGKEVTWRMIYELIESVSPGFDNRLTILTESKISFSERNVAHLLKFGFTQTQIASLLAKDASTISAHRSSLAKKIGYDKSTIGAIIVRL